jgi:hypothetical protein
VKDESVSESV